jgi:hypothetical protein
LACSRILQISASCDSLAFACVTGTLIISDSESRFSLRR